MVQTQPAAGKGYTTGKRGQAPRARFWSVDISVLDLRASMDRPPRLEQCQMRHLRGDRPGIMRAAGNPGHGIATRGRPHTRDNNGEQYRGET